MTVMPDQTQAVGAVAYENGTYTMTLTPKAGGDPVTNDGRYTVVLRKGTDDAWKIALDMDNTVTPPPPPAAPVATDAQPK